MPGPDAHLIAAQGSEIVLTDEVECFWLSGASADRGLLLPEPRRSPSQVSVRLLQPCRPCQLMCEPEQKYLWGTSRSLLVRPYG